MDDTLSVYVSSGYVTRGDLVFGLVCIGAAAVAIVLDWLLLMVRQQSFLDIAYASRNRFAVLCGWSLAAGIVGFGCAAMKVVQQNLQGALAVAISWPLLLTRLMALASGVAPVQKGTNEEVES